ncbi:MAG: flavin reductase family protein [Candidatus Hodarchaeota archaeon]
MKKQISDLTVAYRYLCPRLTILVSSGTIKEPNALAVAWSCPLSVDPPLIGVSITKKRFSHELISQYKDFVVNIPNITQVEGSYYIGSISGRKEPQKLKQAGFTVEASNKVKAPRIKECLINIECELQRIIITGDHDFFIGEVVEVIIDDTITNHWAFDLKKFQPVYWRQSRSIEETYSLDLKI